MFRSFTIVLSLFILPLTARPEVVLYGIVTYQNTGERVEAIQVNARGASPSITKATSDSEGVFRLVFPDKNPGDIVLLDISTRIYDLVNHPRELEVALPKNNEAQQVRLVVCKKGERDQNAVKYYEISTSYITESYERRQAALNREADQLKSRIEQAEGDAGRLEEQLTALRREKDELEQRYQAQLDNAWQLAEDFSRIDLAQADADYQRAFARFEEGKIGAARAILAEQSNIDQLQQKEREITREEEKLTEMETAIARQRRQLEKEKEELRAGKEMEMKKLLLAIHLAELQFDYEAAEEQLSALLSLDSTHVDNLWRAGAFYSSLNRQQEAISWYRKALQYNDSDPAEADLLANLGNGLRADGQYERAEAAYQEALSHYRPLAEANPDRYEAKVATTLNNLGSLYQDWNASQKALAALTQSLAICRRLGELNPERYGEELARTLNNLGQLYTSLSAYNKAEPAYQEALAIRKQLAAEGHQRHRPALAAVQNSLGNLYWRQGEYEQSEAAFLQALDIYQLPAKDTSGRYDEDRAILYNNLGNLYRDEGRYEESAAAYQESLRLYRRLAEANPNRYEPGLASLQNNLGNLYSDNGRRGAAADAYEASLSTYRRLARGNPDRYAPYVLTLQNNLGAFYHEMEDYGRAAAAYEEALEACRRLSAGQPQRYEPESAAILNNLALVHLGRGEGEEVLACLAQSLPIYQKLAEIAPGRYATEVARTRMMEAFVWLQRGAQSKANALLLEAKATAEQYPEAAHTPQIMRAYNDFYRETNAPFEEALEKAAPYEKQVAKDATYVEKAIPQQQVVNILSEAYAAHPDNPLLKNELADAAGELATYLLFTGQFAEAERAARRCLELGEDHAWANVQLATSLLYQGRFEEAKGIYVFWADVWYNGGQEFRDVFLQYLDELEGEGVTHPDVGRAREVLGR